MKTQNVMLDSIVASPYQPRSYFNPERISDLAENMRVYGLIHPVSVRAVNSHHELLAGERRWRAASLLGWEHIRAEVREVNDNIARGIVLSENLKREDLTAIEEVRSTAEWIDFELSHSEEYQQLEVSSHFSLDTLPESLKKIAFLLMKLESDRRNESKCFTNKFVGNVEKAFQTLPTPVNWQSFYVHDLKPYSKMSEDVKVFAIEHKLNKSQAKAVQKLAKEAPIVFEKVKETGTLTVINEDTYAEESVKIEEVSSREVIQKIKNERIHREPLLPHVSHNSGENEWYTPPRFIKAAQKVMGVIDLDPASSDMANQTVKANTFFTQHNSGLNQTWCGNVWMNPPYQLGLIDQFCLKLKNSIESGIVKQSIVLVNNATETQWFAHLASCSDAIVFPTKRISYISPRGCSNSPLQGQAFLYHGEHSDRFLSVFQQFGWGAKL